MQQKAFALYRNVPIKILLFTLSDEIADNRGINSNIESTSRKWARKDASQDVQMKRKKLKSPRNWGLALRSGTLYPITVIATHRLAKWCKENSSDQQQWNRSDCKQDYVHQSIFEFSIEDDELRLFKALEALLKTLNLKWKYYIEDCKEYYHAYFKQQKKKFKQEKKTKWRRRKSSFMLDHENLTTKLKSMKIIIKLRSTLWDMGLDTLVPENKFATLLHKLNLGYFTKASFAELKDLLGYNQHNKTVHVRVIGKWYIDEVINKSSVIQYNTMSWSTKILKGKRLKSHKESNRVDNPELQLAPSSDDERKHDTVQTVVDSKTEGLSLFESILREWFDANQFHKQDREKVKNANTKDMLIEQAHGSNHKTQFKKGKLQHNTIDYMTRRISGTSTDQKVSMAHLIKFPAGTSKEALIKKYPSWTSLSKLGFSFDTCIVALKLHDGDMKLASKWLLSLSEDDIDKLIEFETRNIIQDKKYFEKQESLLKKSQMKKKKKTREQKKW